MDDRLNLAKGYLRAEGWDVKTRGRDLLRGDRPSRRGDGEKDYVYVWVPTDLGGNFGSQEGPYLRRFEEAKEEHPTAEKVFLIPTSEGLSNDFRNGARRWHGVKILVPAQFLDSDFKWERDERAASATSELRRRGTRTAQRRVAQPFQVLRTPDPPGTRNDGDLLDVLRDKLHSLTPGRDGPAIQIVVGPAGMGKSFLFESLYAHLYDAFQSDKRSLQLSARPFALLAEHLGDASAPTIGSLLDAYLQTEFARPMDRDMFNWKLIHGLGIWLLDGLDEILERDGQFFDHLEDLITMPSGVTRPAVVLCVRDSLFTTHRGLQGFCEEYSDYVTVYKLDAWQQPSKSEFARAEFGTTAAANKFTKGLADRPVLDELASTPYYCALLADDFKTDGLLFGNSETEILERGLNRIVAREREKGFLQGVPDGGVLEFIEECAATSLFEGGVPTEEIQELAEVVVAGGDGEEESDRLVTQMGQLAVFARGYDGKLRFAQEPLEHHLVARFLARSLKSRLKNLALQDLPDNVIRIMCEIIASSGQAEDLWTTLSGRLSEDSILGRNALKIVVKLFAGDDRLADTQLAGLNLSGMRFEGHVLRGVSFDGSDLTSTDFRRTDLTNASFDNCLIKGTRFDDDRRMLRSIRFGKMHRYYSAHVGDKFFDDFNDLREIINPLEGDADAVRPACGAARQLRHLFGKFVEETGRGRRKDLPERAMLRGSKIVPHRKQILSEAIRAGYLVEVPNRERISRAQDESYSEIVKFRTDLHMSPGIRAVLDETCREADCPHVR